MGSNTDEKVFVEREIIDGCEECSGIVSEI